jgi:hypothetical protein
VPFLCPVGRSILDFLESFRSDRIRLTGSQSPHAFDIFWPLFTCISQHLSTILCPDQRRSCSSVSLPPRENGNSAYRAQTLIKTFDMLGMVDHAKVRAWTINTSSLSNLSRWTYMSHIIWIFICPGSSTLFWVQGALTMWQKVSLKTKMSSAPMPRTR